MGEYDRDKRDILKKQKRLKEFQNYLIDFQQKHLGRTGDTINIIPDAAAKITSLYFMWLETNVKPFVPKKINKYKISSLAELCIIKVQPFDIKDTSIRRKINAEFAFFCTLSIVMQVSKNIEDFNKPSGHKHVEDVFDKAKDQRLRWLEAKNQNSFPVFSNGLSLYLLFELYHLRFQAIAI